jgi:hypothetical protein
LYSYRYANQDPDSDALFHSHRHCHPDTYANVDANQHGHSHLYGDCDPFPNPQPNAYSDCGGNSVTHRHTHAQQDAYRYSLGDEHRFSRLHPHSYEQSLAQLHQHQYGDRHCDVDCDCYRQSHGAHRHGNGGVHWGTAGTGIQNPPCRAHERRGG